MNRIRQQISDAMAVTPLDGEQQFTAELKLDDKFIGFQGHFPDQPVLPGVCMIAAVLVAAEKVLGQKLSLEELKSAKFYTPILPNQSMSMSITLDSTIQSTRIRARLNSAGQKVAQISLCAGISQPAAGS